MTEDEHIKINTPEGIAPYLTSLAGLTELLKLRMEASYKHDMRNKEFLLLGAWYSDSCGNFAPLGMEVDRRSRIPVHVYSHIPDILTREEFNNFLLKQGIKQDDIHWGYSIGGNSLPPVHATCPVL